MNPNDNEILDNIADVELPENLSDSLDNLANVQQELDTSLEDLAELQQEADKEFGK